jgi:hypothetical protein
MLLPLLFHLHVPSTSAFPQATPAPPRQAQVAHEAAEDVEILRRLLVDALEPGRAGQPALAKAQGLELFAVDHSIGDFFYLRERVSSARGFHLPGSGVFYSIDLSLPTRAVSGSEPGASAATRDDEWERARREVQSGTEGEARSWLLATTQDATSPPRRFVIDERARNEAVDAVLGTLVKHAARVRGLSVGDDVVVALYIEAAPGAIDSQDPQAEKMPDGTILLSSLMAARHAAAEHVVIRVPLERLRAPDATLAEIRSAAQIHHY